MAQHGQKKKKKKKKQPPNINASRGKTYVERREEIQLLMQAVGHPALLNQTQLAEHYGVNKSTISDDFAKIGDALSKDKGAKAEGKANLLAESFYQGAIKNILKGNHERNEKQKEKAFKKARPYVRDYVSYLFKRGTLTESTKHVDVGGSVKVVQERPRLPFSKDEMLAISDAALEKLAEKKVKEQEELLDGEEEEEDWEEED